MATKEATDMDTNTLHDTPKHDHHLRVTVGIGEVPNLAVAQDFEVMFPCENAWVKISDFTTDDLMVEIKRRIDA